MAFAHLPSPFDALQNRDECVDYLLWFWLNFLIDMWFIADIVLNFVRESPHISLLECWGFRTPSLTIPFRARAPPPPPAAHRLRQ